MSSRASKVETAVGTGALVGGAGTKAAVFGTHQYRTMKIDRRRAKLNNYLSQGNKPKRDPRKVPLNTAKKKASLRELNQLNRKAKMIKPRHLNKGEFWVPTAAAGALLAWHGGRQQFKKSFKRSDFDAAAAGGATGVTGYMMAGHAFKYGQAKPAIRRHTGDDRRAVRAYNKTAIPKGGMPEGDPRWTKYWRNYPKKVPGGKTVRVLGHTHGGKSGAALYAVAGAAGATGAVKLKRKISKSDSISAFGVDHAN